MHSSARRRQKTGPNKALIWIPIVLLVLLVAGFVGLRIWFNAFLRGEEFRQLVSRATSGAIRAKGEYEPFRFEGTTIYSDSFHASEGAAFSELRADQLRAEFNLHGLFDHAWQIDEVEMQRLTLTLENRKADSGNRIEKISAVDAVKSESSEVKSSNSWLPNHLDLRKALIREATLKWLQDDAAHGSVEGAALIVTPENGAWAIEGESGKVRQAGWPDLELRHVKLRYKQPSLFITESEFKQPGSGTINASGEINFQNNIDVQLKLNGIAIESLLTPDWRARLRGNLTGDVRVQSALPAGAPPRIEGSVRLADGQLLALPVLDQIALFTRTLQFRTLNLTRASAQFTQVGGLLTVQKFLMESEGLIRIEGSFVVMNGTIDGTFQVGVTPTSLQWLPGSQDKVFTNAHDGYLWTPVRVSGPLSNPNDDLRARLAVAAGVTVIEKVGDVVKDPQKTIEKTVKDGVDLFLSPLLK